MNYEEIKKIRKNPTASDVDKKELQKMIDKAIEKQIPKESRNTRIKQLVVSDFRESVCPSCSDVISTIFKKYPKYCPWCGQAIDWSDDNV